MALITPEATLSWVKDNTEQALNALKTIKINISPDDAGYSIERVSKAFYDHIVNPNSLIPQSFNQLSDARFGHMKSFIDFIRTTLANTQEQLFDTQKQLLDTANELVTTSSQLTNTRHQYHTLAQSMPSGRLLGTVAVSLFIAGALISHLATRYFPAASDALQNNEDDCNEKLDKLHTEYRTMERLGQECITKRKEANEQLTTCGNIVRGLQNKKA